MSLQGDSGGPFVLVNPDGRVEVVGLVSWGFKCDSVGMPGVYTKVQFFVDWIKENIQVNNQECTYTEILKLALKSNCLLRLGNF